MRRLLLAGIGLMVIASAAHAQSNGTTGFGNFQINTFNGASTNAAGGSAAAASSSNGGLFQMGGELPGGIQAFTSAFNNGVSVTQGPNSAAMTGGQVEIFGGGGAAWTSMVPQGVR